MKTNAPKRSRPQRINVNFVCSDQVRIERLKLLSQKIDIKLTFSTVALFEQDFDVYILPAPELCSLGKLQRGLSVPLLAYGEGSYLVPAFRSGCADYLREPWSLEELECRLDRLLGRLPGVYHFSWGDVDINHMSITNAQADYSCPLSYQEYRILKVLLRNKGGPVSREVLFYTIWKKPGAGRVVDMHVSSIRRKLREVFPESGRALVTIRGHGYMIS